METKLNAYYITELDMTIIFEDCYDNGNHLSTEIVGFYYGEPDDNYTKLNANRDLVCQYQEKYKETIC